MAFNIVVQDVDVSRPEGKKYNQAKVTYTYNGSNKTQILMDFANPQVFKDIQGFVGQEVSVEVTKNDKGFNQWSKVTPAGAARQSSVGAPAETKRAPSSYETAEERAQRQVLIVRQSSLSASVGTLSPGSKGPLDPAAVMALAQQYFDWVMNTNAYLGSEE